MQRNKHDWPVLIAERRATGVSVAAFCAARGIAVATFYSAQARVNVSVDAPAFRTLGAPLADAQAQPGMCVWVGAAAIEVLPDFDSALLRAVVLALT